MALSQMHRREKNVHAVKRRSGVAQPPSDEVAGEMTAAVLVPIAHERRENADPLHGARQHVHGILHGIDRASSVRTRAPATGSRISARRRQAPTRAHLDAHAVGVHDGVVEPRVHRILPLALKRLELVR